MLILAVSFFSTRINTGFPSSCLRSYLEGDIALNGKYTVITILNRNFPNIMATISIFVDTSRGTSWHHVKDLIGTFDDGWVMDTSIYAIVDPSVSIMGDSPTGFYLIGIAYPRSSNMDTLKMIVFCRSFSRPEVSSNWECYNMHEHNPTRRDKPWVIGVPGSSRVIGAWIKEDTAFILTNDNHGAEGYWTIRKRIGALNSKFNFPYLTYYNSTYYMVVEEWKRGDTVKIHVLYSTDDGTTWDEAPSIATWFYRRPSKFKCKSPFSGFTKSPKSISAFGTNGLAVAYVYGNDRSDTGRCNVFVSYSFDGGITWIDSVVYRSDHIQGNPVLSSSGDTLLLFFVEGTGRWDTSMVMYGWMEGGVWRNRRIASAPGYHPDTWSSCNGVGGNHYASLITYRDTVYYYVGGDRSRDGYIFSGGGNAWFFRGTVSEITGVEEVVRKTGRVSIRVVKGGFEVPEYGEVYSVSGRLVFRGEGRISLPAGVYFVRAGGKVFKVVVR